MTDHPLSENDIIERWNKDVRIARWDMLTSTTRAVLLAYFRDTYNDGREHERGAPVDDRPWEPLGDDEPLSVGDEVKQTHHDLTTIAVVGGVDKCGNPRTVGGSYIGNRLIGTWYVRRATQELPTIPGTIIIKSDELGIGIKDTVQEAPTIYRDRLILDLNGKWQDGSNHLGYEPDRIIRNTWKVFDPQ